MQSTSLSIWISRGIGQYRKGYNHDDSMKLLQLVSRALTNMGALEVHGSRDEELSGTRFVEESAVLARSNTCKLRIADDSIMPCEVNSLS